MALLLCPECGDEASDCADDCPHCGFKIARYLAHEAYALANRPPSRAPTYFMAGLVVALVGAAAWPSIVGRQPRAAVGPEHTVGDRLEPVGGQDPPPYIPARPRPMPVAAPLPERIHGYGLARRGEALHAQLMEEAGLDPGAFGPVLFGSATPHPRAAVQVPTSAWHGLDALDQLALAHYAASLVREHWSSPETFAGYGPGDPNASYFRANAASMTSESWVILGGDVTEAARVRGVLRAGTVLLDGSRKDLSPQD